MRGDNADDFLSRVLLPPEGESQPTVLSSSFSWVREGTLGSLSDPGSLVSRLSELYSRLAGQGINAFQAAGDWGADNDSSGLVAIDGTRNVAYPSSDPNVISCGGTMLNLDSVPPLEWVWSDSFSTSPFGSKTTDFGSTASGASGFSTLQTTRSRQASPRSRIQGALRSQAKGSFRTSLAWSRTLDTLSTQSHTILPGPVVSLRCMLVLLQC